jgi:carbamoyl-phosphate synthase large subunit
MKELVMLEEEILKHKNSSILPNDLLIQAKKDGFSDRYLAKLLSVSESEIREQRINLGFTGAWEQYL